MLLPRGLHADCGDDLQVGLRELNHLAALALHCDDLSWSVGSRRQAVVSCFLTKLQPVAGLTKPLFDTRPVGTLGLT